MLHDNYFSASKVELGMYMFVLLWIVITEGDLASRLRLTPHGKRQAAVCAKMHKLVFLVLTSLFFVFAR